MMLARIDSFLRHTRMSTTRFGRLAVNDPRLIGDMRLGRQLRPETAARVAAFIEEHGA